MSAENAGPRAQSPAKIAAGGVKKGRNEGEKVVTANRLRDGVVVYRAEGGAWTEDLSAAEVVEGEAALGALAAAQGDESESVGAYLMDVDASDGVVPDGRGKLRETIREAGPTIHPQFAKRPERQAGRASSPLKEAPHAATAPTATPLRPPAEATSPSRGGEAS